MPSRQIVKEEITECAEHMGHGAGGHIQDYIVIVSTSILLLGSWFQWLPQIFGIDTTLIAAIIGGVPIVKKAITDIYKRGDTRVGLLVSIAIIASIAIGEYLAAAEVALIMTIGELLEHITLEKSNTALKKLAEPSPLQARIIEDGIEREIAAELVRTGDRLLIKPGGKIPVDGMVVSGQTTVDQATITGESIPVECLNGVSVFGGTIVTMGSIKIVANVGSILVVLCPFVFTFFG